MADSDVREGTMHLGQLVDNVDDMMGKTRKRFCKLHFNGFYYYASKLAAGDGNGPGGYDNYFKFTDIADIIKTDIKIKAKDSEGKWVEVTKHGFLLDLWAGKKLPIICQDETQRDQWVVAIQKEIDGLACQQSMSMDDLSSDEEEEEDMKGKGGKAKKKKKASRSLGSSLAGKFAGSKMGKSALREFVKPDTLKLLDIYESVMQTYQNLCRGPPVIKTRTPVLNGNMYKRWVIKIAVRTGYAAREKRIPFEQFHRIAPLLKELWSDLLDYLEMPSLVDPPVVYERLQQVHKELKVILQPHLTSSSIAKLELIFRVLDVRFLGLFFEHNVFHHHRADLVKQLRILWDRAFPPVKRRFFFKRKKTAWEKSEKLTQSGK